MESRPSTSDDDFEETVMKWFENCDDLASDIDSDCDEIEDDHDSDSIGDKL